MYINASVSQVSVCNNFLRPMFFCAKDFSLTVRAFLLAEQLRWVETNSKEMRKVDQCSDEMKTVEKNLLNWHVRRDGMRWEERRWGEKSSRDLRDEVSSAKCKCEVQVWSVKSAVWSVKKVFAWRCIAPGSCAGHVLGQHLRNSFAQSNQQKCEVWSVKCVVWSVKSAVRSEKCEVELQMWHVKHDTTFAECMHARAWLAHGACKFYRWERSYIYIYISLSLFKATSAPPRAGTTGIVGDAL